MTLPVSGERWDEKPLCFATPINLRALFSVTQTRQHQYFPPFKFLITTVACGKARLNIHCGIKAKNKWSWACVSRQGKDMLMVLENDTMNLIDPLGQTLLHAQPIGSIRVWGVGRDNGRSVSEHPGPNWDGAPTRFTRQCDWRSDRRPSVANWRIGVVLDRCACSDWCVALLFFFLLRDSEVWHSLASVLTSTTFSCMSLFIVHCCPLLDC